MRRFLAAFERMFPAKKFKRIDRSTTEIKVIFEEFGRESTLDQLSTGEKQIVFRAGFFLRNLERVLSSVVLIDEPELSLHPEWQARVAEFYQTLLTANGRQPQLFIATHSPFVVHGAPNAKVIILEKDQFGKIRQMPQPSYPTVGAEAAIRAFNIDAFLNAAKYPLLVLVEGESDVAIISEAWEKLYPNEPKFFEIRAALGDKNIGITLNDGLLFAKLGNRKIVGLFDFDEGYNQWNGVWRKSHDLITADESAGALRKAKAGPGWAMLLPVPAHRNGYASLVLGGDSILSIEFMFFDSDIPTAWVRDVAKPLGKTEPQFVQSHKMDFAAHVKALAQPSFVAFKPLFDRLRQINR